MKKIKRIIALTSAALVMPAANVSADVAAEPSGIFDRLGLDPFLPVCLAVGAAVISAVIIIIIKKKKK